MPVVPLLFDPVADELPAVPPAPAAPPAPPACAKAAVLDSINAVARPIAVSFFIAHSFCL
jgi:hypothetical protein